MFPKFFIFCLWTMVTCILAQTVAPVACSYEAPASIGSYCLSGQVTPCPAGKFGSTAGLNTSSCSGNCALGYYCPAGSFNATSIICPAGSYCPSGSAVAIPCPAGRYGVTQGLSSVVCSGTCLRGFSCPTGSVNGTSCPLGSYCPTGATAPILCPAGSYGTVTGLADATCSGYCNAGTYCNAGATSAVGIICPIGSYCPVASDRPLLCPVGTFGAREGLGSSTCSGWCVDAGYYCPVGSTNSTGLICPIGSFCLGGLSGSSGSVPVLCPIGRYGSSSGLSSPLCSGLCSRGFYGSSAGQKDSSCSGSCLAIAGFYCDSGSISPNGIACPAGTYNPNISATDVSSCITCPNGSFSILPGSTSCSGGDICYYPSKTCHDLYSPVSSGWFAALTNVPLSGCRDACAANSSCASFSYQELVGITCYLYPSHLSNAGRLCDSTNGKAELYFFKRTCTSGSSDQPDGTSLLQCTPAVIISGQSTSCTLIPRKSFASMSASYAGGWPWDISARNENGSAGVFSDFNWINGQYTFKYTANLVPSDFQLSNANSGIYWPPIQISTGLDGTWFNLFLVPVSLDNSWGLPDFNYRTKIQILPYTFSIENALADSLTSFPLLVQLDASFPYAECNPSGYGMRFLLNGLFSNFLDYEIESWNVNGVSNIWIRVPTVSFLSIDSNHLSVVPFYIMHYYGNLFSTSQAASAQTTWSKEYQLVMHMQQSWKDSSQFSSVTSPSEISLDSGARSFIVPLDMSMSVINSQFGSKGGSAMKLNGNSFISLDKPSESRDILDLSATSFTLESWVLDNSFANKDVIVSQGFQSPGFGIEWGFPGDHTNIFFSLMTSSDGSSSSNYAESDIFNWYHRAVTFEKNTVTHYLNGKKLGSNYTFPIGFDQWPGYSKIKIGVDVNNRAAVLQLDELRISLGVARSSSYFALSFASMTLNPSFLQFQVRENKPITYCFENCGTCILKSGIATCVSCAPGYFFTPKKLSCVATCPDLLVPLGPICANSVPKLYCFDAMVAAGRSTECIYDARRPPYYADLKYGKDFQIVTSGIGSVSNFNATYASVFKFTFTAATNISGYFTITDFVVGQNASLGSFLIGIHGQPDLSSYITCDNTIAFPSTSGVLNCNIYPRQNYQEIYAFSSTFKFASLPVVRPPIPNLKVIRLSPVKVVSTSFTFSLEVGPDIGPFSLTLGLGDAPRVFNILPLLINEKSAEYVFAGQKYSFSVVPRVNSLPVWVHSKALKFSDGLVDSLRGTFSYLSEFSSVFNVNYTSSVNASGLITLSIFTGKEPVTKTINVIRIPDSSTRIVCPAIVALGADIVCTVIPRAFNERIFTRGNLFNYYELNNAGGVFSYDATSYSDSFTITFTPNEGSVGPYSIQVVPGVGSVVVTSPLVPDSSSSLTCDLLYFVYGVGPQFTLCTFTAKINSVEIVAYADVISKVLLINGVPNLQFLSPISPSMGTTFNFTFYPFTIANTTGSAYLSFASPLVNVTFNIFSHPDSSAVLTCASNVIAVSSSLSCTITAMLNSVAISTQSSQFSSYYSTLNSVNASSSCLSSLSPSFGKVFEFTYTASSTSGLVKIYPFAGGIPFTVYQYDAPDDTSVINCGVNSSLVLVNTFVNCTILARKANATIYALPSAFSLPGWSITSYIRKTPGFKVLKTFAEFGTRFEVSLLAFLSGPFKISAGFATFYYNVYAIPDGTTTMHSCPSEDYTTPDCQSGYGSVQKALPLYGTKINSSPCVLCRQSNAALFTGIYVSVSNSSESTALIPATFYVVWELATNSNTNVGLHSLYYNRISYNPVGYLEDSNSGYFRKIFRYDRVSFDPTLATATVTSNYPVSSIPINLCPSSSFGVFGRMTTCNVGFYLNGGLCLPCSSATQVGATSC